MDEPNDTAFSQESEGCLSQKNHSNMTVGAEVERKETQAWACWQSPMLEVAGKDSPRAFGGAGE